MGIKKIMNYMLNFFKRWNKQKLDAANKKEAENYKKYVMKCNHENKIGTRQELIDFIKTLETADKKILDQHYIETQLDSISKELVPTNVVFILFSEKDRTIIETIRVFIKL